MLNTGNKIDLNMILVPLSFPMGLCTANLLLTLKHETFPLPQEHTCLKLLQT